MPNIIAVAIVIVILGLAIGYIIREKKRGAKCIGCPHSKSCGSGECHCGDM
ncbi:MAG: FeoB-associated Cys-rich membrane protein [Oscillospiraceae bacterium]|nr:FeoB-associated Cys-rich membrane protein [Oscillospiraceae bacterium]